jgi:ribosomal protein S18 acetylase RimI-like enzyme
VVTEDGLRPPAELRTIAATLMRDWSSPAVPPACPTHRFAAERLLPQLSKSAAPLDADGLARIASHQATTLFIARSHDVIVGMLTLVTFPLPSGLRARIEDVVVDQDARGQGVGTAMTMAAIDQAQAQGARSIDLTSRASRVAADQLYQHLGFQLRDSNVYRYQPQPRPH